MTVHLPQYEQVAERREPIAPARNTFQLGKKEPFRSVPSSAKTPSELALLMVKVTPFWITVKVLDLLIRQVLKKTIAGSLKIC